MVRSSRWLPASIERALNSALSRGPGYEPTPIGSTFDDRSVRGYYIDFRTKTTSPAASNVDALPATQLIQLALGWWERHLGGDAGALDCFLNLCEVVERRAEPRAKGLRWPIRVPVPKYRLTPGWCSALPQGQAGSVFARAYLATGREAYAELATAAIAPLLAEGANDLVVHTSSGPILEEAPSTPPSHILNGWISALWGLWDAHQALANTQAQAAFEAGVQCLRAQLPAYDTGWWSLYSLYPHAMQDLAKPIYHRFHVTQLDVLHRLTGHVDFRETADRWRAYDHGRARIATLTQKAAFAALDARRRRKWAAAGLR